MEMIEIKGIVNAYLVDEDNNLVSEYPADTNFITPAGKSTVSAMGIGTLMTQSTNIFGNLKPLNSIALSTDESTTTNFNGIACDNMRSLTLILANISNKETVTSSTLNIPVFSSGNITSDKVIGYVNNDIIPNADGLGGVDAFINDTPDATFFGYLKNANANARRFKFDLNTAVGIFNAIILAPYTVAALGCIGGGVRTEKFLDGVNPIYQNFGSLSSMFIIPEITGVTTADEVIMNYSQDSFNRHKVNLDTGVLSDLDNSFALPNSTYMTNCCDMWYDGTRYLYTLHTTNGRNQVGTNLTVRCWDSQSSFAQVGSDFAVSEGTSNMLVSGFFVKSGTDLYVSFLSKYHTSSYFGQNKLCKLTHNGTTYASAGTYTKNYTAIGYTNNTQLPLQNIGIKSLADGTFALIVPQIDSMRALTISGTSPVDITTAWASPKNNLRYQAYIVANLTTTPAAAVINHKRLDSQCIIHATTTGKHRVFSVGSCDTTNKANNESTTSGRIGIINLTKTTVFDQSFVTGGIFCSDATMSHALMTVFLLDTPVTKPNTNRLFVTYAVSIS